MDLKKTFIYISIGFLLSALFFGIFFAFMNNNQSAANSKAIKTYEYNLGEFSTNLGNTRSYFKGSIILEVTNESLISIIEEKNVQIRDGIISILIEKNSEEILDVKGQSKLKNEILETVSSIIDSDGINNIYFADYIVQ